MTAAFFRREWSPKSQSGDGGLWSVGDVIGLLRQLNRKRPTHAGGADRKNGSRSGVRPTSELGSATVADEARTLNETA